MKFTQHKEFNVKLFFVKIFSTIILLGFSGNLLADTRVEHVWTCTINEGKTMKEIKALNSKWVAFVKKSVKGGDVQSHVATAIVGTSNRFIFIDSFANLADWSSKEASMNTEAGRKLTAEFNELGTCSSSALYSVESS